MDTATSGPDEATTARDCINLFFVVCSSRGRSLHLQAPKACSRPAIDRTSLYVPAEGAERRLFASYTQSFAVTRLESNFASVGKLRAVVLSEG